MVMVGIVDDILGVMFFFFFFPLLGICPRSGWR